MNPLPNADATTSHTDQVLADLVEAWTARLQAGEALDADAFARQHPEHAEEIRRLLPALQALADLERSAHAPAPAAETPAPPPGLEQGVLGDFRILREAGRGGMGVVYEAEQLSLRRRVALKVLPFAAALDARQLRRFQNEAEAAAHLHHTNIVPVYAVGCERGVHYYAMQLIDGRTLAQVVEELRRLIETPSPPAAETEPAAALTTERSIRTPGFFRTVAQLGVQAAEALDHAHEQGVIHRDVKPANLMVDGRGHLWIADFGLARCRTETGLTVSGDLVGTLRYMSPEQALARRAGVDHRTDVYSLGATLYELLTLRHAFPGDDRQELLRQIAFEEPTPPRRLNNALPAELETIILKALARNPAERYATAQEMADDLRRFLDDKPIRARRPTLGQRLGRWARRHRQLVVSAAVVLVLAVVGLTVSNLLILHAQSETERERQLAVASEATAVQREKEAEANFRLAEAAVQRYFTLISQSGELKAHGLERLRKQLLKGARDFYQKFVAKRGGDPRLRRELGEAYYRLGMITSEMESRPGAFPLFRKALEIAEGLAREQPNEPAHQYQIAACECELGNLYHLTGQMQEARRLRDASLAHYQKLAREHPANPDFRWELAGAQFNLGALHALTGELRQAERAYQEALTLRLRLVREYPKVGHYRRSVAENHVSLGVLYQESGDLDRAEAALGKARDAWEELTRSEPAEPNHRHWLARVHYSLGKVYLKRGQLDRATEAFRTAVDMQQRLADTHPSVLEYQDHLALILTGLAALHQTAGRSEEAQRMEERALAVRERLALAAPDDPAAQTQLALTYRQGSPRLDLAEEAGKKAVALRERLAAEQPAVIENRHQLGSSYHTLAGLYAATGKLAKAAEVYAKALAIEERLVKEQPAVPAYRNDLGATCTELGRLYAGSGQPGKAEPFHRRALEVAEALVREHPDHVIYRVNLAQCCNELGLLYRDTGRPKEARRLWEQALAIRAKLAREHPRIPRHQSDLAQSHFNLTLVLPDQPGPGGREAAYRAALAIQEGLVKEHPIVPEYRRRLALTHNGLGIYLLHTARRPKEAEAAYRRSLELREQLVRDHGAVLQYRSDLGASHNNIGNLYMGTNRPDEAEAALKKALAVRQALADEHPDRLQFVVDLGGTCCNLGHLQRGMRNKPQAALGWYGKAVTLLQGVVRKEPGHAEARRFLTGAHACRAETLAGLGRAAESLPDWEEAVRLEEAGPRRVAVRFGRVAALAEAGKHAQAAAEAERLASHAGVGVPELWTLAQVCALCAGAVKNDSEVAAGERGKRAEEYAARAVGLLRRAHEAGAFGDPALRKLLRTVPALEPLRSRSDFARLLAEVEK